MVRELVFDDLQILDFESVNAKLGASPIGSRDVAENQISWFQSQYVDLLRWTGRDTAERVARRCLDVDLEAPEFWNASLDTIAAELANIAAIVDSTVSKSTVGMHGGNGGKPAPTEQPTSSPVNR